MKIEVDGNLINTDTIENVFKEENIFRPDVYTIVFKSGRSQEVSKEVYDKIRAVWQ